MTDEIARELHDLNDHPGSSFAILLLTIGFIFMCVGGCSWFILFVAGALQ